MTTKKKRTSIADGMAVVENVVQMSVDELIPYERNARTHSDDQIENIARSITEFGFNNPILIDSERGIIAGHGRLLAARRLGMTHVPTIELGHLTDEQKRAYVIADNQLALLAGWDYPLLAIEMEELATAGFDVGLIGFSDKDMALIERLGGSEDKTNPENHSLGGDRFLLMIEFDSEQRLSECFEEMTAKGLKCKILQ